MNNRAIRLADALAVVALGDTVNQLQAKLLALPNFLPAVERDEIDEQIAAAFLAAADWLYRVAEEKGGSSNSAGRTAKAYARQIEKLTPASVRTALTRIQQEAEQAGFERGVIAANTARDQGVKLTISRVAIAEVQG